ncbi:MAG: 16S rRNA (guanine(527)-N(7))-methyltransferase RsmG [Alphaproteobacteria bacterium]|nr:16S rRNA (guanine(527)-N(7))-methyltransferase RsmG [Alphaproteobacteria bacterium]
MNPPPPLTLSQKLEIYRHLLLKWSRAVNLVAPSTLAEIDRRHFQDSLQLLPYIPPNAKILYDFGSGAGFPALPLAMARPLLEVHVFESDQKKCSFMQNVSRETLTPIHIHNERIESVSFDTLPLPDVVSARALAGLGELIDYAQNCWEGRPSCHLIFLKGAKWQEEVSAARQNYEFDLVDAASETLDAGRILILSRLRQK